MRWWSSIPRRKRFRITFRAAFLLVGAVAAYAASILLSESLYGWAILPSTVILIAAVVEFVFGDVLTEKRFPARTEAILENLKTKIHRVHNQLLGFLDSAIKSLEGCDKDRLNGTIHLLVRLFSPLDDSFDHAFVQITSYRGPLGGIRWRFAGVSKGVIGRCFRTHQPEYVNFAVQKEYDDRMVREFGYSRDEMKRRTMPARSYWAQPLFSRDDNFVGVMYLFTVEPQVFPRAANVHTLKEIAENIVGVLEAGRII